ncbi:4-hydroxy-tetrahydrodipicolinate synthase [Thiomicrospira sp. WB1]|uniref:4-hydroxy-tetrahydrodipicolinate synthase n=1 Tax=Thiomicrospira sp. WB1 TaxID=1685380 RepID=UPI000748880F|nr:4-hydroxy-tetrahydrodipicolinate synthase [Thiomicrospira sp. WB1]KUJ72986.1 4-hydroxy-tetrahydrodipicolinate synthase [Thiomicrospira sp. WB1]
MLKGSMVALVTPMKADESLDFDALGRLVEFHIQANTKAIVATGTTGESATLDFDEHEQVLKFIIEKAAGRIPVIAGTGGNSTSEAIMLTEYAHKAGADACLLVTPYYNKPTQEGLYQHYKKIAETVEIDQILYNVPGRTACDLLPETVGRLASINNIVGIKEATGDVSRVAQIQSLTDENFALYTGEDANAVEFLLAGGHGGISVTANVAPQLVSEVYDLALAGQGDEARLKDQYLMPLHQALFLETNPIPVKWAMAEMGMMDGAIRLPMTPLSEKYHATVRQALESAGVL